MQFHLSVIKESCYNNKKLVKQYILLSTNSNFLTNLLACNVRAELMLETIW